MIAAPYKGQELFGVVTADRGKEREELVQREPVSQVVQERLHGNASALEDDGAAHHVRAR